MLLAEIPTWQSAVSVAALFASALSLLFAGLVVFYMKRQTDIMAAAASQPAPQTISPQPLSVSIEESLHEQFADKDAFGALVTSNTARHAQLFSKIEAVEKDARSALGDEVFKINCDRQRTMEKLNEQFTFIRESLAAINTELKLKRARNE
jgi:hypothetical protein